mmetsp:Transcript_56930/g.69565  ORF Transcript_56930/g.69565 Transcript_56930/m.69565 type:complete len:263 (+) Transcript_56930:45-833(+)
MAKMQVDYYAMTEQNVTPTHTTVRQRELVVIEDETKFEAAIKAGADAVQITAEVAGLLIAKQEIAKQKEKNAKRLSCFCCCITLILLVVFISLFAKWKKNANEIQISVLNLRNTLNNEVLYSDYYTLLNKCQTTPVCYETPFTVSDTFTGYIALPKRKYNPSTCYSVSSDAYYCSITFVKYVNGVCKADDFHINYYCKMVKDRSERSCISSEDNGNAYYYTDDACDISFVETNLLNGAQVTCGDCDVVGELEIVISEVETIF